MKVPISDYRMPLILAALICTSCSKEEPVQEPDGVVARIGDRFITAADLQAEARRRMGNGRPVPTKEELLENMLANQAVVIRAQREGLADDPGIRREIEILLAHRLRSRELDDRLNTLEVTEEDMRAEYERRIVEYTRPAMDRFAMLFLRIDPNASDARQQEIRSRMEEAQQFIEQQATGKDFGSLALDYSDDQLGRYRGGDIGWIADNKASNRLPATILEAGRALEPGVYSDILEAEDGLYIIKKTDTRPATTTPFGEVHDSLRRRLLAERRQRIEANFVERCLQQAAPQIDRAALAELELEPLPQQPDSPTLQGSLPVAGK